MGNTFDDDNRQAVAAFHCGPIPNLVGLSPSTPCTAARRRAEPEQGRVIPFTTRTRIAAESMRNGLSGNRARCMPPEVAEPLIPFKEENSVLSSTRKRPCHTRVICDRVLVLRQADMAGHHGAVTSRAFRFPGVDPELVPPARVLADSPRGRLAKTLLWLCYLADPAGLRGLGVWR